MSKNSSFADAVQSPESRLGGFSALELVALALFLVGIHFTARHSYLLFHSIAEFFSIFVAVTVFLIVVNSWRVITNQYFLFVGVAYGFIAILDSLHTLSYKGMGVFTDYGYYAPQVWIAARYLESISMVLGFVFLRRDRRIDLARVLLGFSAVTALLIASIFYFRNFPVCFEPGIGLTTFKVYSEYVICALLVLSLVLLHANRSHFTRRTYLLLQLSLLAMIATELCFTLYVTDAMSDFFNELGHYCKIVSFYLIYKAIVATGLGDPLQGLARELEAKKIELESKRLLDTIFTHSPDMIFLAHATDHRIVTCNPRMGEFLGRPADAIPGNTSYALLSREQAGVVQEKEQEALANRASVELPELKVAAQDGQERILHVTETVVLDENGAPEYLLGIGRDITARKVADAKLYQMVQVVEQTPESIVITDLDANIVYANEAFCKKSGYSREELTGQNPRILQSGKSSREIHVALWAELTRGKAWHGELVNRRKDGTEYVEIASIAPLRQPDGTITHYVGVKEDITERKRLEDSLAEFNRDFEAFLNQTTDFVYFKDGNSRFRFCSQTLAEITHHAHWQDMIGKHDTEVFPLDTARIYAEEELPIFAEGKPLLGKVNPYYDAQGNTRYVMTSKWPLFDQDGNVAGIFGISRDVTNMREAQAAVRKSEARLRAVFSMTPEPLVLTRLTDGVLIEVSESFARSLGYSRSEMIGRTTLPGDLGLWVDTAARDEWLAKLSENGEVAGYPAEIRQRDGALARVRISAKLIAIEDESYIIADMRDITAEDRRAEELLDIAQHDPLTGLPNRLLLSDRLRHAIQQNRRANTQVAICYLDLDGFKTVNDAFGHDAGDRLLVEVASRLTAAVRAGDTVARLGGDEFVLLLCGLVGEEDFSIAVARLVATIAAPYLIGGREFRGISASIGVTLFPHDGADPDTLVRHADHAMYSAKQSGKNRYHLFDMSLEQRLAARHATIGQLRQALERRQFVLHYQPKVDARSGRVVGVEALIRWQHPRMGTMLPASFLPMIEEDDLAIPMGQWVIREALCQMERWQGQQVDLCVSVNVFAKQLQEASFTEQLGAILREFPEVPPGRLVLEIIESAAIEKPAKLRNVIEACQELGVAFSLDDFGTGYSSLLYLRHLPVEEIKIDQAFVRGMLVDADDQAIVDAVISLGRVFDLAVVAEGVESTAQIERLLERGCNIMQGYAFARPMPGEEIPAWVARHGKSQAGRVGIGDPASNGDQS